MRILSRLLPVLVWMWLIFFLSSQSSLPRVAEPPIQFVLSKGAHFTEYFVLALLLVWAQTMRSKLGKASFLVAFVIVALYAASDEFHQSFVPNRTASPWDVLLDSTGAATGVLVLWAGMRRLQERTKRKRKHRTP